MSALDIRPHSRRLSGLVVVGLVLLGTGAFGLGLAHQLQPAGPSPFPPAQQQTLQIAVATPAPELQTPTAVPTPVRHAASAPVSVPSAAPDTSSAAGDSAPAVSATDASANAPDQAAPASAPQPVQPTDSDAVPQI